MAQDQVNKRVSPRKTMVSGHMGGEVKHVYTLFILCHPDKPGKPETVSVNVEGLTLKFCWGAEFQKQRYLLAMSSVT